MENNAKNNQNVQINALVMEIVWLANVNVYQDGQHKIVQDLIAQVDVIVEDVNALELVVHVFVMKDGMDFLVQNLLVPEIVQVMVNVLKEHVFVHLDLMEMIVLLLDVLKIVKITEPVRIIHAFVGMVILDLIAH
jgi:hypothetical protein